MKLPNKRMLPHREKAALLGRLTLRFSRPKCGRAGFNL